MMEVSIISTEIIKPSSPTPDHLRIYKLSLLDQLNSQLYYTLFHFYSGPCTTHHLKIALSNTLTHYYPFAGRVHQDGYSILCDDTGVTFIEAKVSGDVSDLLKPPQNHLIEQLAPQQQCTTSHEILSVQLNHFNCGGVAISVGFRHVVADAVSAAYFIKTWATLATSPTAADITHNVVYDCTSIFPPQDISHYPINHIRSSQGTSLKRFVFDCSNISALRQEFGNQTTRFQVLAALVWGAVIAAKRATNHEYEPNAMSIATIPINLRNKTDSLSPPIPDQCIGNIIWPAMAFCPIKDTVDYKILATKLQESISMINIESVKKTSADGSRLLRGRGTSKNTTQRSLFMISSSCRLPFYDTDFGWGKPVWVTFVRPEYNDSAVFLDTRDGKGIELWITLPEQDMAVFEQDPTILAYASFNPSIPV